MLESGAQCVIVAGTIGMQQSYVCNWDFKEQVQYPNIHFAFYDHTHIVNIYTFILYFRCNCS